MRLGWWVGMCVGAACAMGSTGVAAAGDGRVTEAGTVISWALPVGSAAYEALRGDTEGLKQLGLTWASTVGVAEVLKNTTGKTRPDGSDKLSFPSGHAARAFGAAAHVNQRYGLEAAWPLYVASVAVGWSRVQARRHDWTDVAGAAALGEIMSRTWTRPAGPPPLSLTPLKGGLSFSLAMPL